MVSLSYSTSITMSKQYNQLTVGSEVGGDVGIRVGFFVGIFVGFFVGCHTQMSREKYEISCTISVKAGSHTYS